MTNNKTVPTDVPGKFQSVESVQSVDLAVLTDPEAIVELDDNVRETYMDCSR